MLGELKVCGFDFPFDQNFQKKGDEMSKKRERYAELVEKRKHCFECEGLLNPSEIDGGIYDCDHIGAWSLWQGSLDAKAIIVGQDFSELAFFREKKGRPSTGYEISATNKNLITLIREGLWLETSPYDGMENDVGPLFFTNSVLCIKQGSASASIKQSWANRCCRNFLKPLIEDIIKPKVVITLSVPAYKGVLTAFNIEAPTKLKEVIELKKGIALNSDCRLFSMYHCGGLGLRNRRLSLQIQDWKKVRRYL